MTRYRRKPEIVEAWQWDGQEVTKDNCPMWVWSLKPAMTPEGWVRIQDELMTADGAWLVHHDGKLDVLWGPEFLDAYESIGGTTPNGTQPAGE